MRTRIKLPKNARIHLYQHKPESTTKLTRFGPILHQILRK